MEVLMYTAPWCRDCRETKRYLDAHQIAYSEIDIEAVPGASDEVLRRHSPTRPRWRVVSALPPRARHPLRRAGREVRHQNEALA
jgi:hypothetical protein